MRRESTTIITHSEAETVRAAQSFAGVLKDGDVLLLHGDLGAGKSVFARALIRALSDDADLEVPSPTFTLVQTYDTAMGGIWHFDLYRLSDPSEIYEIGWEEALQGGVAIIEWPERLGSLRPQNAIDIHISVQQDGESSRQIEVII